MTIQDCPAPQPERAAALAALLASDESSNQTSMTASIALIGILVSYISITSIALSSLSAVPVQVFCWLAVPPILLQVYQMLLAASVMRRGASGRRLEQMLFHIAEIRPDLRDWIGAATSDSVMNVDQITKHTGGLPAVRRLVAYLPYIGFYALGIGFTVYVVLETLHRPGGATWAIASGITYGLLWALFLLAALQYFMRPMPAPDLTR